MSQGIRKMTNTYIVMKQTITITHRVRFTDEMYPDCATPEDAAQFERGVDLDLKLENFGMALERTPAEDIDYGEVVTVEYED